MAKASRYHPSIPLVDSVRRQNLERVTVVGQQKNSREVMEWLAENGFRIIQSGPYTDREMFPSVDVTRFKFVAEREHAS